MYKTGLRELVKVKAIKHVARGVYQINPTYAGKGEWKYNPRLKRGGIENLIATFNLKEHTVETQIIWADDGDDSGLNTMFRDGLGVQRADGAVLANTYLVKADLLDGISKS
jgi:hypothetical protein